MSEQILYVPTKRYVYFDNNGEINSIANRNNLDGNFIEVELNEVINLITAKEPISKYVVLFDTVTKKHVLRSRFIEEEIQFDINNQVYKIPIVKPDRPDFILVQDTKKKKWFLKLDESIKENLKNKSVQFTNSLVFSITKHNDPHILYNLFVVDLKTISEQDIEIPFTSEFELDSDAISVYTTKRLETYYHEVLK